MTSCFLRSSTHRALALGADAERHTRDGYAPRNLRFEMISREMLSKLKRDDPYPGG